MQVAYEERYHELEAEHWWFVSRRHLVRALIRCERPDRTGRILDLGCASGQLLQELRAEGYTEVTGIDFSEEAVARCCAAGADARLMDAQKLDFPDATFDVINASDVLEHLPEEGRALREWGRVLKPGGLAVIFVPAFMFLWTEHDEANMHFRRYRRDELVRLIEANGLVVQRSSYWNSLLFPPVAAIRFCRGRRRAPGPPSPGAAEGSVGDLFKPMAPLNACLTALLRAENHLSRLGLNWPVGISAFALARRPA